MQHDAWFFVGIFVFIFIVWIAMGGPMHPISFAGPTLSQPQELGGGTYLEFPRAVRGVGQGDVRLPGSSYGEPLSGSSYTAPSAKENTTFGIPFGTPSPYRPLVSLSSYVSQASTSNEYLELSISPNAGQSVAISNWTLVSGATGKSGRIPLGTSLPVSGNVNAISTIVLQPGDRAIIASGKSPFGASFKENKCIGYFGNFQSYTPSIPYNCPTAESELTAFYPNGNYIQDPSCIDYVHTLPRCAVPIGSTRNLSRSCRDFITTYLNYNGCVTAHRNDPDFMGTTWRIYLGNTGKGGKSAPLWRSTHEFIKLFDETGKTVAQFSY